MNLQETTGYGSRANAPDARRGVLEVRVLRTDDDALRIAIGRDEIRIEFDTQLPVNAQRQDFAVWLALPIAMRRNLDLHLDGAGSEATICNANRMAETWSRWLPRHFQTVRVSVAQIAANTVPSGGGQGDLCFYSGGVDSTYALLGRHLAGKQQSLLTIHGMDYRYNDGERFADLVDKTAAFAGMVGSRRLFVRTNAYEVYKKYKVNPKGCDVGHAFVLSAAAFMYSDVFARAVIAADYRYDQQFDVQPWGTNAATNRWFDDGRFALHTESQDVTRAEKCPLLMTSPEALASLSFCVDYSARPHNCGKCQKCVRTKAMFVAATGSVPAGICLDTSLEQGCLSAFDLDKTYQRAFFFDLYETAVRNGNADAIPGLADTYRHATTPRPFHNIWLAIKQAARGG